MTIDYQNKTKNPRRRMPVGAVLFIMAVVVVGAFIFYFFREKAMADIAGNYSKTSGDLLTASDWNNLDNDFLHVGNITQQKQGALILNTGGSTNGLIVQSGNVGIGTTAPGAKLHVVGGSAIIDPSGASANAFKVLASNGNTAFSISNTGTAESFVFGSDGLAQASFGIITSGNTIKFQTHTVDRMAIDTSGNVGIGTTTPLYPLTISNIFPNGAAGIGIDVSNTVSQNFIRMTTNGDLTTRWEFGKSGTSNLDPGNFYLFHGIANRVLTATPSGNVGIGTTGPKSLLHIKSDSPSVNAMINLESDLGIVNQIYTGRSAGGAPGHLVIEPATGKNTIINNGNVGIGTTVDPGTNKLQVNGKIQAIGGDICTDQGGGKCLSAAGVPTFDAVGCYWVNIGSSGISCSVGYYQRGVSLSQIQCCKPW